VKTIDGNSIHKHRWRRIGAHSLHAGLRGNWAVREVRHVSVCSKPNCGEVRVHIREELALAVTKDAKVALSVQTSRLKGQTTIEVYRRAHPQKIKVATLEADDIESETP
jgi:hypothetical protein